MRIVRRTTAPGRARRDRDPLRFEICCGGECDGECRRRAMQDRLARWAPLPIRMG